MGAFFKPWRKNIGVVTLLAALMFMVHGVDFTGDFR